MRVDLFIGLDRNFFSLAEGLISRNGFLPRTPLFLEIFLEISLFPDYSLAAEAQNIQCSHVSRGVTDVTVE